MVSREIAPELCAIYQQSYETGQVLLDWKQANVTAIFKKGDKTNSDNYRSMSLKFILCKNMEHVIFSQTMGQLVNHDTRLHFQHGFRLNHSCETQLLNTVEDLSHRLDKQKTTESLVLDFSKGFNTVPPQTWGHSVKTLTELLCHRQKRVVLYGATSTDSYILSGVLKCPPPPHRSWTSVRVLTLCPDRGLILNLNHYGITLKTNQWIETWLFHRQERVVLYGATSTDSHILSKVPQGTVLGPLMFLLYVNNIGDKISPQATINLFADDALLYRSCSMTLTPLYSGQNMAYSLQCQEMSPAEDIKTADTSSDAILK